MKMCQVCKEVHDDSVKLFVTSHVYSEYL